MRPTRLELEGFASFRAPVTVDFSDADLFVLAGPTGAGKSSLVDAMTMALYGAVPRYDDRRVVAPVISQGCNEARIRLDFTVGTSTFTAVRVIRRTRTGGTTKEARLERWLDADGTRTVTLAGNREEVDQQVERLLGLKFEHFTSCMVLPQGAFQHFLHARPKDRQDLLVQLLDLDVYRRVGQAARDRATATRQEVDLLQRRLDGELADATPQAVTAAGERVDELEALLATLDEAQPRLDEIQHEGSRLREVATTASGRAELLADLSPPDDLDRLVDHLTAARTAAEQAEADLEAAGRQVEEATARRQEAGDAAPLTRQGDRLGERAGLQDRLTTADAAVEQTTVAVKQADELVGTREHALTEARQRLHRAQQDDLVAAVLADHQPGDPCPVCDRPLETAPDLPGGAALEEAQRAVQDADLALAQAVRALQDAERQAGRAQADRDAQHERLVHLDDQIAAGRAEGLPDDPDEVRQRLEALEQLDQAVTDARTAEQQARTARRSAQEALTEADQQRRQAAAHLNAAVERVAQLQPPLVDRDDLGAAWTELQDWATRRRPELLAEAQAAQSEVAAAAERWKAEANRLRADCAAHGVHIDDTQRPRDACVRDLERARVRRDRLAQQADEAADTRRRLADVRRQQRVATALGQHLRSSNFEKWLLNRALRMLVRGATSMLRDLSAGAYSLTLDDSGGFAVVDHRNGDEIRSARSLSGGETFLTSLALALALSEHVADLAARGAARLESLILDEGFGTLDAETLDLVATTLEELGSRGRMIGVITHVEALAERLPVRYAVRKEAGTSSVERVS